MTPSTSTAPTVGLGTRIGPAIGLAFVMLVVTAGPAAAHTVLRSSLPADGEARASFDHVELHFTEPVEVAASHVYLQDSVGFIELGKASAIGGNAASISVAVPPLGDGTYVLTWHVVATDGDPAEGTFTVTVDTGGSAATTPVTMADPAADFPPDTSLAIPLDDFPVVRTLPDRHGHGSGAWTEALIRAVLDFAVAVLVGGMAFLSLAWPKGARVLRARRLLWLAGGLALFASYALTAFQHATAAGLGPLAGLAPWHQVDALDYRFGRIAAARALLLVAALGLVAHLARGGAAKVRSRRWRVGAVAVGLGLIETVVLLGHAQSAGPLAGTARLLHVAGISVWVGGLVMVLAVVLPRRRTAEVQLVLPRFSSLAAGAVAILTAGGIGLALDLVGSPAALLSSGYGRLLLVKVGVVVAAVAAASRSRRLVAPASDARAAVLAVSGAPGPDPFPDGVGEPDVQVVAPAVLVRWVATEIALVAFVLAVTAALLSSVPPA